MVCFTLIIVIFGCSTAKAIQSCSCNDYSLVLFASVLFVYYFVLFPFN